MKRTFKCRCGQSFRNFKLLTQHVAIGNPHWPRSSPDDLHRQVYEYVCAACGQGFHTIAQYSIHEETHGETSCATTSN